MVTPEICKEFNTDTLYPWSNFQDIGPICTVSSMRTRKMNPYENG